jgi:hypothetical protein
MGPCNVLSGSVRFSCVSSALSAVLLIVVFAMVGCGSGGSSPMPSGQAPTISAQPASAVIPLDSSATLSVSAAGTGPLSYQWSLNGSAISGANSATLTTAALQLSDSGDKFSVTISNAYGSATSGIATITIGPRSPAQRDMRFKHVQVASSLTATLVTGVVAEISGNSSSIHLADDLGPPVSVGNQNCGTIDDVTSCGWGVDEYAAPAGVPGFNSFYGVDALTNLGSDLTSLGGNSVMTSLDEQTESGLAEDIFAYSVETDPTVSNGFTLERVQATDATLATTVSAMAAKGVVVTAVSANSSGGIDVVAYGWTGDAGTAYDAQTVLTSYASVGSQALGLAQEGYIVTAVGTADANQVLLVGTKVRGDTLPRNLFYSSLQEGSGGTSSAGQIVVGNVFGNDAGNNPNLPADQTLLTQ